MYILKTIIEDKNIVLYLKNDEIITLQEKADLTEREVKILRKIQNRKKIRGLTLY